jgi:hypothetical protein
MARARASRLFTILLCGGAAAALLACDGSAVGSGEESPPPDESDGDGDGDGAFDGIDGAPEWPALDDGCLLRAPGQGFGSVQLAPAGALGVIDLEAAVTAPEVEALVGLGRGGAASAGQLAVALRLAPGDAIEVRDGNGYRADAAVPVEAGRTYPVRVVADVTARAYSVYVRAGDATIRIAQRYALRLSPGGAAGLDALSAVVAGRGGQLAVCNIFGDAPTAVAYSREGSYAVAPLPDDRAIVSDGISQTWKLGPAGEVLGRVRRGGEVAADEAGDVYIALAAGGQLALYALTPELAPRWSRVDPIEPEADVRALAADAAGVTVALSTAGGVSSIRRYPADGALGSVVYDGGGALAALGRDGFAVAAEWPDGIGIGFYDLGGRLRWYRAFDNDATAEVMTLGLDGRVVLGGHFAQPISFGGPTLEPVPPYELDVNSYAVALAIADGSHAFTARIPTTRLTGAAANAGRVVIAGETWVVPIFPHLWQLDAAGNRLPGEPYVGFYEQWGRSGRVAVSTSNRMYWERAMVWPGPDAPPFPYLLAIRP